MTSLFDLQIYLPVAGLWQAYTSSSAMGQSIVLLQLVMSVAIWSVMLKKWDDLREMKMVAIGFRKIFDDSVGALDIYRQRRKYSNPVALIYQETCHKLYQRLPPDSRSTLTDLASDSLARSLSTHDMTLIKGAAEQSLSEQQAHVERGMNFLATGATIAPLLGLLGTVWGLLDAFQSMAGGGSAMLADIAPGIASAMLTTVVGLLVAIPSGIGYNFLLGSIRLLSIQLDGFTDELLGRLASEYLRRD